MLIYYRSVSPTNIFNIQFYPAAQNVLAIAAPETPSSCRSRPSTAAGTTTRGRGLTPGSGPVHEASPLEPGRSLEHAVCFHQGAGAGNRTDRQVGGRRVAALLCVPSSSRALSRLSAPRAERPFAPPSDKIWHGVSDTGHVRGLPPLQQAGPRAHGAQRSLLSLGRPADDGSAGPLGEDGLARGRGAIDGPGRRPRGRDAPRHLARQERPLPASPPAVHQQLGPGRLPPPVRRDEPPLQPVLGLQRRRLAAGRALDPRLQARLEADGPDRPRRQAEQDQQQAQGPRNAAHLPREAKRLADL